MASEKKVAIVTGASSGIGRDSAIALSKAGWYVSITARRKEELEETKSHFAEPSKCLVVAGDVADEAFVKKLFEDTVATFGRLDMVFNNAGRGNRATPIEDLSLETFAGVMNVNIIAPFLCTREAFKIFKSQSPPGGRIINNGSLAAHVPRPHSAPYTCSKHAITGLTKASALEGRPFNIAVTQIDIGNAHTPMAAHHLNGCLQGDGRIVPEPTFDVQHVASTVVHVASLPNDVNVLSLEIMATGVPYVGRG